MAVRHSTGQKGRKPSPRLRKASTRRSSSPPPTELNALLLEPLRIGIAVAQTVCTSLHAKGTAEPETYALAVAVKMLEGSFEALNRASIQRRRAAS